MFKTVNQWWQLLRPRLYGSAGIKVAESDSGKLWEILQKRCPDCGKSPVELYEGPSGGMSTNVFCSNCGHGYNITPMLGTAEDIGVNLGYCTNDLIKAKRAIDQRFAPPAN